MGRPAPGCPVTSDSFRSIAVDLNGQSPLKHLPPPPLPPPPTGSPERKRKKEKMNELLVGSIEKSLTGRLAFGDEFPSGIVDNG